MKHYSAGILVLLLLILPVEDSFAQSGKVPPFRMMQSDGRVFMAQYLPVGKPIVIIYFSPDCEECQKLTASLLARIDEFKNVSIAMITYQPVKSMIEYVKKNNLTNYQNVYAGTEYPGLFVRNYYNIMHFPFVALYTKDGDLVKKYNDKEASIDDLVSRIKLLR
ncbi:MAG TPA: hypothetical protein VK207_07390 [Bacteroidales bacterium]|nr:hypothetical protein [Bacteroidales bacterium]